jgi:hypothetical protein
MSAVRWRRLLVEASHERQFPAIVLVQRPLGQELLPKPAMS